MNQIDKLNYNDLHYQVVIEKRKRFLQIIYYPEPPLNIIVYSSPISIFDAKRIIDKRLTGLVNIVRELKVSEIWVVQQINNINKRFGLNTIAILP